MTVAELETKVALLEENGAPVHLADEIALAQAVQFARIADVLERLETLVRNHA